MRRSDIMHQEPILSGNLQPADLPNPYEPVRSEEKIDNHAGEWKPLQPPQYKSEKPTIDRNYEDGGQHDEDDEEHIVTAPLRNEQTRTHTSMPSHTGKTGTSGYTATSQTIDALRGSTTLQNWLSRLLRFSSSE